MMRRAFTLIEVLLAMAILMALLSAFFVFLRGASDARQSARQSASEQLGARTLCDVIERDLLCCLVGDQEAGPGVAGDAERLTVLTRSVATALATRGFDDPRALSDLEAVTVAFDAATRSASIVRSSPKRPPLPHELREESDADAPAPTRELIGPIERLRFRYFDGSDWHETFDSLAQNRLPVAVEISLWLDPQTDDASAADAATVATPPDAFRAFESDDTPGDEEAEEDSERDAMPMDEEDLPPPNVVRVIVIHDALAGSEP